MRNSPTMAVNPALLIRLLLVGLPWLFIPGIASPFKEPKLAALIIGLASFLILTYFLGYEARTVWRNRAMGVFLLAVIFSWGYHFWTKLILRSPDPATSVIFNWYGTLPAILIVLSLFTVRTLSTHFLYSEREALILTQWFCYTAFIVACCALLQYAGIDPIFAGADAQRLFGGRISQMFVAFGNVGETASYLTCALPLCLMFNQRRYAIFFITILSTILLTQRLYAILALIAALNLYFLLHTIHTRRSYWRWAIGAQLILATIAATIYAPSFIERLLSEERWIIWSHMAATWTTTPLLGFGLGSFAIIYMEGWQNILPQLGPIAPVIGWTWAHNEPLQLLFELGLLGMIPFLIAISGTIGRAIRSPSIITICYLSSLMAFIVISLGHLTWHMPSIAIIGIVIWAMLERKELMA